MCDMVRWRMRRRGADGGQQDYLAEGRRRHRARPLHVHVRLAHGDRPTISRSGSNFRRRSFTLVELPSDPASESPSRSFISARSSCRPTCRDRRSTSIGSPSILRLQIGLRRRRVDARAAARRGASSVRIAPRPRRPPPATMAGRSRCGLTASTANPLRLAPQRQRALPPQPLADRSRRPRSPPAPAARVTTSAARSQSSASASGRSACATRPPPAICVTQPASSQETPSASEASAAAARIGIGRQPLLEQKGILAGAHQMQPPVPAADGDIVAVGGDQDIRLRHRQRPDDRSRQHQRAGPAQRRAQQPDQDDADAGRDQRADAERRACGRPRRAAPRPIASPRSSSRCRCPSATRTRRRSRTASRAGRAGPPASPAPTPPASPRDWRARHRA